MKRSKFAVLLAAISFCVLSAKADTVTFTYTGEPMVSVAGAVGGSVDNCASCSINGIMTLAGPIPPLGPLATQSAIFPLSYSFTATGLGTFNEHNSTISMKAGSTDSGIILYSFRITGPMGMIESVYYGSGFEFSDDYSGPNGKHLVAAQGNYTSSPWSVSETTLSSSFTAFSDTVPTPEPGPLALLFATLPFASLAKARSAKKLSANCVRANWVNQPR